VAHLVKSVWTGIGRESRSDEGQIEGGGARHLDGEFKHARIPLETSPLLRS
jgi:hypothetical protein